MKLLLCGRIGGEAGRAAQYLVIPDPGSEAGAGALQREAMLR